MGNEKDLEQRAKQILRDVLSEAARAPYRTTNKAWRDIVASLGFETSADLSLIRYFDEQDQARFQTLTDAYASKQLEIADIVDLYLEFFPRPAPFKLGEGPFYGFC